VPAKGDYRYKQVRDWSCSNESKPWQDYPSQPPPSGCYKGADVSSNVYWSREYRVEEIPVTYPPATISAQPLCSLPGQNGWCRSGAGLQLTGHEPVSGYSIFALGGTRNGELFSLQAATGSIPALEGRNDFEYWAYSTWGDTSHKSTTTLLFDSQPPVFGNIEINGTNGNNDWRKSATLSASASDPSPGSGLGGLAYTLDGSNWASLASPASLPDGIHNLQVRASDLAGNTSHSQADEIKIDSLAPALSVSESGTGGANGWYISTAQVSAAAQDDGSGLAALEVSHNGAAWAPYAAPISLPDGTHSLSFWAEDMAGWVTQDERQIRVDTQVPTISGQINATSGTNNWYTSTVTVTALASDPAPASGIETFTYALNGAPAQAYTAPLTLTDGQHSLTLTARDQAGLEKIETLTIWVDTVPPTLQITSQYSEWVKDSLSLAGTASDGGSGLQRVEVTFDNGQTWHALSSAGNWSITRDTNQAASGAQTWHVRAIDKAGLSSLRSLNVQVDNQAPRIDLPESWSLWDTVTFDARDADSGLANAELVISDPQNRWPKRVYTYQPGHLPHQFKWDRRFGDGTLAPLGDYQVKATATDRMGNTRVVYATLRISLGETILVPPTATPLGTPLPTATPTATPQHTAEPFFLTPSPTPTGAGGSVSFGATSVVEPVETPHLTPDTRQPDTSPLAPPRATPTESPFTSWLGSLFTPPPAQPTAADEGPSPIDWGAGALAADGRHERLLPVEAARRRRSPTPRRAGTSRCQKRRPARQGSPTARAGQNPELPARQSHARSGLDKCQRCCLAGTGRYERSGTACGLCKIRLV
jgi:hypothetical protein